MEIELTMTISTHSFTFVECLLCARTGLYINRAYKIRETIPALKELTDYWEKQQTNNDILCKKVQRCIQKMTHNFTLEQYFSGAGATGIDES